MDRNVHCIGKKTIIGQVIENVYKTENKPPVVYGSFHCGTRSIVTTFDLEISKNNLSQNALNAINIS